MWKDNLNRRHFLRSALTVTLGFRGLRDLLAAPAETRGSIPGGASTGFGPLVPDPNRVLDLPMGFSYRVISKSGERMDDGFFVPGRPDGMGAFPWGDGKTLLIRNHELLAEPNKKGLFEGPFGPKNELLDKLPADFCFDRGRRVMPCQGGTTTLVYDTARQHLDRQYLSLAGTQFNCSGGPTPWGTWITCEEDVQRADGTFEKDHGYPFEVAAKADGKLISPTPIRAMGRFRREAVAVDPATGILYQTEDRPDGLLYRYIPEMRGELMSGGTVQALAIRGRKSLDTRNWVEGANSTANPTLSVGEKLIVDWIPMDDLQAPKDDLRIRGYALGAARFARQEGIWFGHGIAYFACTEGGRTKTGQIWKYSPSPDEGTQREADRPATLELFIEPNDPGLIENADNLTLAPWGDLVVCEDGSGDQFLVGVTPTGSMYKIARNAASGSEFAGSVFSPDGTTLFVNLQGDGVTLALTGPWPKSGHATP